MEGGRAFGAPILDSKEYMYVGKRVVLSTGFWKDLLREMFEKPPLKGFTTLVFIQIQSLHWFLKRLVERNVFRQGSFLHRTRIFVCGVVRRGIIREISVIFLVHNGGELVREWIFAKYRSFFLSIMEGGRAFGAPILDSKEYMYVGKRVVLSTGFWKDLLREMFEKPPLKRFTYIPISMEIKDVLYLLCKIRQLFYSIIVGKSGRRVAPSALPMVPHTLLFWTYRSRG